jgi:pimeloyl-ACP methyl ester carboxylesterase
VVIDRLAYGASGHPQGLTSCIGGQADVAHQIVSELRSGGYTAGGHGGLPFSQVGLIGHSAGGLVAQVEAYSFHDVDALGVMSFSDRGASPRATQELAKTGVACLPSGRGYAFFGQTPSDFSQVMFANADPAVSAAATSQRLPDPCGDIASIGLALAVDAVRLKTISVPVLLAFGTRDALFPPPAAQMQRALYPSNGDVTVVNIAGTGHAVTLERTAPALAATVAGWLRAHQF